MTRRASAVVLAAAAIAIGGVVAGCGDDDGTASQETAAEAQKHEMITAPAGMTVGLRVLPDTKKGYNAVIDAEGFRFAPAKAGGAHVTGEGHAHLYVDGVQIARPYSSWHWFALDPGMHEVRVTLNANTHAEYSRDGEAIAAEVMVDVPESGDAETHTHAEGEDPDHGHPGDDDS